MRREAFFGLADRLNGRLQGDEVLFARLGVEASDFVRLNQNRVRQAGSVRSADLGLTLIQGRKQVEGDCQLSGDSTADEAMALSLLQRLRERLPHVPDDPYLNVGETALEIHRDLPATLPDSNEAIGTLTEFAEGLDLVGIWAAGSLADGLASSIGHRCWQQSHSFNLDWSCYLDRDKAVKESYSGFDWQPAALAERIARQRERLAVMARPQRRIEPDRYRAYLAPAAVQELMDMLAWGGFGLRDHRTHQTPLLALVNGEQRLHPDLSIHEEHGRGLSAGFTDEGFAKPPRVALIEQGRFKDCLVDARSAKEYGEPVNAAVESPESVAVGAGDLPADEVLARLGTGIYVGNLWYCNWSDRNACRVTGMTRFGTFWVENGALVAPLAVMRFDDSLYHLLGDRLEALTAERELILSPDTYGGRSSDSALLPGILVGGIELAL
ncbi:peptidase [Thiohalocapsa marina]|uniref:Peptidase n=1 Tax=Thiohalocapsa marina TaxID=424902 RepID=A0A5M8FQA4_9GAMM|nr:metallopeptidase TldD-related protein [Thiohalocapsa marina]KAA6186724.1 peptidase [Thiohalocapsa marina]